MEAINVPHRRDAILGARKDCRKGSVSMRGGRDAGLACRGLTLVRVEHTDDGTTRP